MDRVESQTHTLSDISGSKTWLIQRVSSFSLLFAYWSVKPDRPAHLNTMCRPPIIPPQQKSDCKNRQSNSVIMSRQQQTVDSSLSWRILRCFSPKPHMEAISVAVRTGTFPSPPPHSLDSVFGMHHRSIIWELIKDAAQEQSEAQFTWCLESGIYEINVNIRLIIAREWGFFWERAKPPTGSSWTHGTATGAKTTSPPVCQMSNERWNG